MIDFKFNFSKKNILIVGGSRGIGKGIAEIFIENGCSVAITYNSSKAEAEKLVNKFPIKTLTHSI